MLRAYIESNLEFMQDNPNQLSALVEIVRATIAGAKSPFSGNRDGAVHILAELLTRFQTAGDFRTDLDPNAMAIAIRAASTRTQRSTSTNTPAKQSRSST